MEILDLSTDSQDHTGLTLAEGHANLTSISDWIEEHFNRNKTDNITDGPRGEDWSDSVMNCVLVKNYVRMSMDTVLLIGVLYVCFQVFYKQRNFQSSITVQLMLLLACYICFEIRNFQKIVASDSGLNDENLPNWIWYPYSIAQILFLTQHWVFTN